MINNVSIIAEARGFFTREGKNADDQRVDINEFEMSVRGNFAMPLSINQMRRLGRKCHYATEYKIIIQVDDKIYRVTTEKITAKYIYFKFEGAQKRVARTETKHSTRKTARGDSALDVGVDIQEFITMLLSEDYLNLNVSRKRVTKKPKDEKHAELLETQNALKAQLDALKAQETAYLESLKQQTA